MLVALDCETTGVDPYHGSRPFFVTTCDEDGDQTYWEWDVDPLTRMPVIPPGDRDELDGLIETADEIVMQNGKFDVSSLATIKMPHGPWPWEVTQDTLIAGHLLASNQPHDLTVMALVYLGVNIKPFEDALKQAVKEARSFAKANYPDWVVAKIGDESMPSVKGGAGACDYWLPRAVAEAERYPPDHPWRTVLRDYSNADSAVTVELFKRQRDLLRERGLWEIYLERMKCLPVAYEMERGGVTVSETRLEELRKTYRKESGEAGERCLAVARQFGYDLELPKTGNNNSLLHFCFGKGSDTDEEVNCKKCGGTGIPKNRKGEMGPPCDACDGRGRTPPEGRQEWLRLPVVGKTDSGKPSLDKAAIMTYLDELEEESPQLEFVRSLSAKRKRDTALNYMDGYERYWLPWVPVGEVDPETGAGWYVLHPSLNATGTDTLRWSSSNPNEQNISKQEGFNLRYAFGPAPGREWWSLDYENIELRIPAYESGEEVMVELFERPDEPPYFGSYHLLNASIVYPDLFSEEVCPRCLGAGCFAEPVKKDKPKRVACQDAVPICEIKGGFKAKYNATWYKWCKNGGFAIQYGCQEKKADATFRRRGAYRAIKERMPKVAALNAKYVAMADRSGYVETIPDRSVCPERGYPLLVSRSPWGKVSPTLPLNYHVQSTACWIMMRAMVKVHAYLKTCGDDYRIALQVHDELVLDFPAGRGKEPWKTNLPKIRRIQSLMTECGDDVGIPLRTSREYHSKNWGTGVSV